MRREFTIGEAISDPLIAQLRRADGISDSAFARLLVDASDAYRATAILNLHRRRQDLFYQTIGAGGLVPLTQHRVPEWRLHGQVSDW